MGLGMDRIAMVRIYLSWSEYPFSSKIWLVSVFVIFVVDFVARVIVFD